MEGRFPQYLSKPLQIIILEADEFLVFILTFTAAMMSSGWILWVLIIVNPYLYIKFKQKYPNGYFKHIFYIAGLKDLKGYPISFELDFYE